MRSHKTMLLFCFVWPLQAYAQNQLIFAIDLIRHGDRTPIEQIPSAPHNWPLGLGQLTPKGQDQEHQLGQQLRKKYVDTYHLLPADYSAKTIYVRSTDVKRTQMSAQAFLLGLYPLDKRPKGTGDNLPMVILPVQDDMLRPDYDDSHLNQLKQQYVFTDPKWMAKNKSLASKYPQWSKALGSHIQSPEDLMSPSDTLYVEKLYHVSTPKSLSPQDVDDLINHGRWAFCSIFNNHSLSLSTGIDLLKNIALRLQQASKQNADLKYVLFSAHDATISTQMALLGSPPKDIPKYASDLNFSLFDTGHKQFEVHISFNGKPVRITACKHSNCTLNEFVQFVNAESLKAKAYQKREAH